jgi:hypothetical protein
MLLAWLAAICTSCYRFKNPKFDIRSVDRFILFYMNVCSFNNAMGVCRSFLLGIILQMEALELDELLKTESA